MAYEGMAALLAGGQFNPYMAMGQSLGQVAPAMANFKNPWASALVTGLSSLAGGALMGYGADVANRQAMEANGRYLDTLTKAGVSVPEGLRAGFTDPDPQVREQTKSMAGMLINADMASKAKADDRAWDLKLKREEYGLKTAADDAKTLKDHANRLEEIRLNSQLQGARELEQAQQKADLERPKTLMDIEEKAKDNLATDLDVKTYRFAAPIMESMSESYKKGGKQASLDLIYGTAKITDPSGTVTEASADGVAQVGGGLGQKFKEMWNYVTENGELTPEMKDSLLELSQTRFNKLQDKAMPVIKLELDAVKSRGGDPAKVWNYQEPKPAQDMVWNDPAYVAKALEAEADRQGVPKELVLALAEQESALGANAKPSSKGARGIMQLMPDTAKMLGVDPDSPPQNIKGGVAYLKQMLERYPNEPLKAIAAYNAGPGAVDKAGGVPDFQETQQYIQRILNKLPPAALNQLFPGKTIARNRTTNEIRIF